MHASRKHVCVMYTTLNHTFIWQNWGIPIFLIFAPKHRLWVLVRTALPSGSNVYPQSMFWSKKKKEKYQNFSDDIFIFYIRKKSLYIAWASFRNVCYHCLNYLLSYLMMLFIKSCCGYTLVPFLNVGPLLNLVQ